MSNTDGQTADEWRAKVNRWVIGSVIALAVVLGVVGCVAGSMNSGNEAHHDLESIAQCEARIAEQLKSPSTASFDSSTTENGANEWTVTGVVSAENSFGATVPVTYKCTVTIANNAATTTIDYLNQ